MPTASRNNGTVRQLAADDPYNYYNQVANGPPPGSYPGRYEDELAYQPYGDLQRQIAGQYQQELGQLTPYGDLINASYWNDAATRQGNVNNQMNAFNQVTNANADIYRGLGQAASSANTNEMGLINSYGQALGQANQLDANNVAELRGVAGSMRQLDPSAYVGDYSSNPMDVARQQSSYDQLGGFASGAYNIDSQAALAEADAEALAAQKEVMGKLKERTDPRLTDAERALFMQARLQREQSDRANRDANMQELARRGMSGSTMQLSNLNASSQEAGNTRALADTTAAGKAVERSENALRDYGNMSNVVADQSFKREFSKGSAADQTSQFNVGTQMAGTQAQAGMANTMRGQNDAIGTFNKQMQQSQNQFADNYRATQQTDAFNRADAVSNAGFRQSENVARNAGDYTGRAQTAIDNGFNRTNSVSQTGIGMNRDYMQGLDSVYGRQNEALRDNSTQLNNAANFGLGMSNFRMQGNTQLNNLEMARIQGMQEDRRARQANTAAKQMQQDQQNYESSNRSLLSWLI